MRSKRPKFFNAFGIGLVEVLVSVAIMGVVAVSFTSMFVDSLNAQKNVEQRYSVVYLVNDIHQLLASTSACTQTFTGKQFDYSPTESPSSYDDLTQLRNAGGTAVYKTASDPDPPDLGYMGNSVKIKKFTVSQYKPDETPADASDPKFYSGTAVVRLEFEKVVASIGPSILSREFNLRVNLKQCSGCPSGAPCEASCGGVATQNRYIDNCQSVSSATSDSYWSPSLLGSGIFYNGNVGIGTAIPTDKFQVNGELSSINTSTNHTPSSARLDYCNTCGTAGAPASRISAIGSAVGTPGEFRLDLYSSDASVYRTPLFVNSAGNVGIGTSSPQTLLHLVSEDIFPVVRINGFGAGGHQWGPHLIGEYSRGSAAAPDYPNNDDILLILRGQNKDSGNSGSAQIVFRAVGAHSAANAGGAIEFYTTPNGSNGSSGVERLVINHDGNVGIGTTDPQAGLGVDRAVTDPISGNAWAGWFRNGVASKGVVLGTAGGAGLPGAIHGVNSLGQFDTLAINPSGGNVGIGTTTPDAKLEISGGGPTWTTNTWAKALHIENGAAMHLGTGASSFLMGVSDNGPPSRFYLTPVSGGGLGDTVYNYSRSVVIDHGTGNVGIGVTGPTSKLQVAGDITPDTTATKNLGSSSLRWNNIYLSNAPDVSSDARLKKDVQTSDLGLDFINSLRPVSWTWKDPNQGTAQHYGVIAQETEFAIAKAKGNDSSNIIVTHNEETDSYSVRYTELISPLIKAVQELYNDLLGVKAVNATQDREIASVKAEKADKAEVDAKVQKLEAENAELRARLEKIEKALNSRR